MIRVNDIEIDDNQVVAEMQYHQAGTHTEAKNKAARSLIVAELIKQRAEELGVDVDSLATDEQSIDSLIEQEISIPRASEEDCLTYYQNNLSKFTSSPLVSGRHILLSAPPNDATSRSEARELAKVIIRELQGDADRFAQLAAEHSKCPSNKTGGHLGQISKGQTVPEFERQLFKLEVGLAAAPIESRYGIHIVDIEHRIDGKQLPFEAVKKRIKDYLNEKVKRKAIAQYIEVLIENAEIEGFDIETSGSPLLQ